MMTFLIKHGKNKMKVVFLDVDGVLNYEGAPCEPLNGGFLGVCQERLWILKDIIEVTGAVIVVSSTWRLFPKSRKQLKMRLATVGLEVHDWTVLLNCGKAERHQEIRHWLEGKGVTAFSILDDDDEAFFEERPEVNFRTCFNKEGCDDKTELGLTDEIRDRVISHLNA